MALFKRLEEELSSVPGVTGVAAPLVPLLAGSNWGNGVSVEGFKRGPDTDDGSRYNEMSPGYFRTLGIPLMAGREFTAADAARQDKGRHRQRGIREEVQSRSQRRRQAHGRRDEENEGKLDTEIVGFVQRREIQRSEAEIPPLFFRPYRQTRRAGLDDLLRADVARTRRAPRGASHESWRGSTRTCRSKT